MRTIAASLSLLALLAVSCRTAAPEPVPGYSIEHDLSRNSDAAIVNRHPRLLRREGSILYVRSSEGERSYRDRGRCAGFDTCERHRARAVLRDRYVALEVSHGEGADTLLIDSASGNVRDIGAAPHPSPSGELFFVGFTEEVGDWSPLMGASVWRLSDTGAVAERLRLVDTALVYFTGFSGWRSERCAEFRGTRGSSFGSDAPERSFFLVERGGDWQLLEEPLPQCVAGAG